MKIFVLFIIALSISAPVISRILDRCSLAKELFGLGVSYGDLARWTCIAERESAYNTTAKSKPNKNGSNDYGIFQINSRYWCKPSNATQISENDCNIDCDDLVTDDIVPSLICALQIKKQQGWTAWVTLKFCNGTLPSIDDCFVSCKNKKILS